MGSNYLISRRWALTSRFAVTDETGAPQFEVRDRFALGRRLSVCDAAGAKVAVISRQGMGRRYQILADGQETTVSARGFHRAAAPQRPTTAWRQRTMTRAI